MNQVTLHIKGELKTAKDFLRSFFSFFFYPAVLKRNSNIIFTHGFTVIFSAVALPVVSKIEFSVERIL